eukprot:SAG11_NODE_2151_length_3742_cov_1.578644_5_plen_33_part_00
MDSWAYMQEKINFKAEQTDQYIDTNDCVLELA